MLVVYQKEDIPIVEDEMRISLEGIVLSQLTLASCLCLVVLVIVRHDIINFPQRCWLTWLDWRNRLVRFLLETQF
ncbi:hypothetical protein COU13_01285 [Candidatus Kaiserbacteria bacterium CG10_big_fil_rev_8_21_14_0_10_43_70]|uniref:Uncharacterized protein n=1 Tax=Candidatus Kaiserbacteria bacterium CG10_big_fil_rev_8_21_14_0_10_43_70 TaxID=1974605 RepID=A0A2H0UIZ3_9BACT|nr:MAG: hypothetical protein COU13_01285 [Candidatus Kaiserbacteria bacterium CG10_big_fil_rev_8_21_14_0_10_43_70]